MRCSKEQKLLMGFGFVSHFFCNACVTIPSPFLPLEIERHGLTSLMTGIMLGVAPLCQFIFSFFWGRLIVLLGLHSVLMIGVLMTGVSTAAFGLLHFIPPESQALFLISGLAIRVVVGVGISAIFNATLTLITVVIHEDTTLMMSIYGAIAGAGAIGGPFIGSGFYKVGGFFSVFIGAGSILLLLFITLFIWFPKLGVNDNLKTATNLPYKRILLNRRVLIGLTVYVFSSAQYCSIDPILEPELRKTYGLHPEASALVFLMLSVTYIIVAPIAGKTVGKPYCVDSMMVMLAGLLLTVVASLFTGPSPFIDIKEKRLWILLVSLSVMGLTNCLLYVPALNMVYSLEDLNLLPETNMAVKRFLSTVWIACYSLGNMSGMVLSGALEPVVGFAWTFTVYAAIAALFSLITISTKVYEICTDCSDVKTKESSQERTGLLEGGNDGD